MKRNRIFFTFILLLSIFIIPSKVFAKTDNVYFQWNQTGDISKLNLTNLESMKQKVYDIGLLKDGYNKNHYGYNTYENFYDNTSFFIVYNDDTEQYEFNLSNADSLALMSYYESSMYTLSLYRDITYYFDINFNYVDYDYRDSYNYEQAEPYIIYTTATYDHMQDSEDLFKIDFDIIAANHDFKVYNSNYYLNPSSSNPNNHSSGSWHSEYVKINNYDIGSVYLGPFNEYGLLTNNDYSESLTYTFKSSESTAVKIKYKILEGSVTNTEYEISSNWFKRFFGIKDKTTTTIDIDNFNYYVSASNEIIAPVRYYSDTNGESFKRLPRDVDSRVGTSFSASVKTLNYNEGVRSGYIYFDLSNVSSDTTVTITVEYNPHSMKFLGLEKSDSFDSLTEVNIKDYYAIGLIPKFDISQNFYSFPLYYKGNVGFSYSGNFEDSKNNNYYTNSKGSSTDYQKYLIDFGNLSYIKGNENEYYNKPYLYIRNFDIGSDTLIRYNNSYFDILYFSNDNSCQDYNNEEYCSINTDDWQWGTIDSNGDGNSGTTFTPDDSDIITIDPVGAIETIGAGASKVISLLIGGLNLLGDMIVAFRTILPSNVIFVLDAILTITGFVIIINFIKKL